MKQYSPKWFIQYQLGPDYLHFTANVMSFFESDPIEFDSFSKMTLKSIGYSYEKWATASLSNQLFLLVTVTDSNWFSVNLRIDIRTSGNNCSGVSLAKILPDRPYMILN